MRKIIQLDDYFPTGEATLQPVLLWGPTGSRLDAGRITKTASEALDYIKNVKPEPGKTHLLVLALGSEEAYGPNRNGDGFPEHPVPAKTKHAASDSRKWWVAPGEELTNHYQSFETNPAHAFQHHCFPAGTPVLMENRDRKPIEDVCKGDLVVTLDGPRPVTNTMNRTYNGPGIQLHLKGDYLPLAGTEEHPVQIFKREQLHCPHNYSRITESCGCSGKICKEQHGNIGDPQWIAMRDIRPGDYLILPLPIHGNETVEPAFARLVGWVASEGYLGKKGSIQFTFSAESEDAYAVKKCLEENGLYVNVTPRPQYNTVMLTSCSKDMHARLSQYIQGTLSEKRLTEKVMTWDRLSLLYLLGTYIDGDGHIPHRGRNAGQLRIRSSSPQMLRILSDVIRAMDSPATVQWDSPVGTIMCSPTNGKLYEGNGSGVVTVEATYSPDVARFSRKRIERSVRTPRQKRVGRTHLVQVTEANEIELNETVYNLEVEGPHHFVANEVVVHNCNKDPNKASGHVKKAFWNPKMHRVELLIVVDNQKDPEWVQRVNDGDFPAVSMGCRIKYDVCARCGNQAPTRKDYCDHVRNAMNQVNPDGTKNYVHNPSPNFFDISRVFRPADRTGYTLKKVAHAYEIHSSAELGETADDLARKAAAIRKLSDIDKIVRGQPVAASSTLSNGERTLIGKFRDYASPRLAAAQPIPQEAFQGHPLAEALATLASIDVPLTGPEFVRLVISHLSGQPLPEGLARKTAALLPTVLALYEKSPALLDDVLKTGVLNAPPESVNPVLRDKLAAYISKRANLGQLLYRNLVPEGVGIRPDEAPTTDLLHYQDPTSGRTVQTTRGAAIDASESVERSNLKKMLGGAGLLYGGYKLMGAFPSLKPWRLPAAALAGYSMLRNRPSQSFHTSEGFDVPTMTEFGPREKFSEDGLSRAVLASLNDLQTTGVVTANDALVSYLEKQGHVDATRGVVLDVDEVAEALGSIVLS